MMHEAEYQVRKLRRVEYDRLVACALLGPDDEIELLDGQMVRKEPQYRPHATGTELVAQALRAAFGAGFHVRVQAPVALDEESEPEPDVSVVPGDPRDYRNQHPARPVLVKGRVSMSPLARRTAAMSLEQIGRAGGLLPHSPALTASAHVVDVIAIAARRLSERRVARLAARMNHRPHTALLLDPDRHGSLR